MSGDGETRDKCAAGGHGSSVPPTERVLVGGCCQSLRGPQDTVDLRGQRRSKGSLGSAKPVRCQSVLLTTSQGHSWALGHLEEAHIVLCSVRVPGASGLGTAQVVPGHVTHPAWDQTYDPLSLQSASKVVQSVPVLRFFINLNCFPSQLRHISRFFLCLKT